MLCYGTTMHFSDTSSISQHLKKHSCLPNEFRKILTKNTTILEQQNNKQKQQILEALHIRNVIVVLKKTTLQLYCKTFIEKINSGNLIM